MAEKKASVTNVGFANKTGVPAGALPSFRMRPDNGRPAALKNCIVTVARLAPRLAPGGHSMMNLQTPKAERTLLGSIHIRRLLVFDPIAALGSKSMQPLIIFLSLDVLYGWTPREGEALHGLSLKLMV